MFYCAGGVETILAVASILSISCKFLCLDRDSLSMTVIILRTESQADWRLGAGGEPGMIKAINSKATN